jgi:uncharacterized protein YggE
MTAAAQTPATQASADATLLSVSARGQASRVPDVATASAGVVTQAADASAAMRANAEQMNRLMAAIRAAGVAEKDTRTTGISVNPDYRYAENRAPEITGYRATNTVSIKVRDIDKLGKVLDALVANGANDINGPSFEIDQPEAVVSVPALRARASQGMPSVAIPSAIAPNARTNPMTLVRVGASTKADPIKPQNGTSHTV